MGLIKIGGELMRNWFDAHKKERIKSIFISLLHGLKSWREWNITFRSFELLSFDVLLLKGSDFTRNVCQSRQSIAKWRLRKIE